MLIGGRIVPSFTRNWLARRPPGRLPAPFGRFDALCMAVGAVALAGWIAAAEHQMAVEQLRKRKIMSPCAGYVVEIARDVGEACEAYQPLVRVVDPRRCYFVSNVEAKTASRLALDQRVQLIIEAADSAVEVTGKVVFLSPVVDPASGLRKVKVLFDNAERKVSPGVAGRIRF